MKASKKRDQKKPQIGVKLLSAILDYFKSYSIFRVILGCIGAVALLIVCAICVHNYTISEIGEAVGQYDEDLYDLIEAPIQEYVLEGVGMDILALRAQVDYMYTVSEGQFTDVRCGMRNGYFFAEIQFNLDEGGFVTTETDPDGNVHAIITKNYSSSAEYAASFWKDFNAKVFIRTLILFAIIFFSVTIPIQLISMAINHFLKKQKEALAAEKAKQAGALAAEQVKVGKQVLEKPQAASPVVVPIASALPH